MSVIYTLTFRDEARVPCMCGPEERLDLAVEVMQRIGAAEKNPLLVLPAGYVWTLSPKDRDGWVEGMAAASRDSRMAIVFGIDVETGAKWSMDRRLRSYAFAYDCGRPLLEASSGESPLGARTVTLGGLRATVLFGQELFRPAALAAVAATRPDVALVLGHGEPTHKWREPLSVLNEAAPTLVVHQSVEVRRPAKAEPPRGWRATVTPGLIRVTRYVRQPDGAGDSVVGH
ncbi:MAG: hypothetical protein JWN44_4831 [Myxococcales bacterium]|nr:hypothetical protein [Myxococcales bacterium]